MAAVVASFTVQCADERRADGRGGGPCGRLGKVVHKLAQGGGLLRTELAVGRVPVKERRRRQAKYAHEPREQVRMIAHRLARNHRRIHRGASPIP